MTEHDALKRMEARAIAAESCLLQMSQAIDTALANKDSWTGLKSVTCAISQMRQMDLTAARELVEKAAKWEKLEQHYFDLEGINAAGELGPTLSKALMICDELAAARQQAAESAALVERMREAMELAKLQLDYDADALGVPNDRLADKETSQALALTPAAALAEYRERVWRSSTHQVLKYDDPEVPDEVFNDFEAALVAYHTRQLNWNCHLFVKVPDGELDAMKGDKG